MRNAQRNPDESGGMIVWIDYCKLRGKIVSARIGPSAVIRRSGESLEAFEGRAMSRSVETLYGAIKGI